MTREFLQNIKVGEQALSKEVIDTILDENSRDIGLAKKDVESLQDQLKTAKEGLKAFDGVDIAQLQGKIAQLQQDLAKKDADHQAELAEMAFDRRLDTAISVAKGRSAKAIKALLEVDALRQSKNQETDIKAALEGLKKESGYLFETEQTPPPYAAGTGSGGIGTDPMAAYRAAAGLKPEKTN